jgi:hypothetical protein
MNCILLAASFALAPAASASLQTVAPVASSSDSDRRALDLLRTIRAAAEAGDSDTTPLRAQLAGLTGPTADGRTQERVSRALGYLDLMDAGRPLPPPAPDEAADSANGDAADDAAVRPSAARAKEAADARKAAQRTAALLDQVAATSAASGPTSKAAFDGAIKRRPLVVEVEPAPGYHTVNVDDFLAQPNDDARLGVLTAATIELLEKAGRKDKDGKHALILAKSIQTKIQADPSFAAMTALRVRAKPDGRIVIVYRTALGIVAEEDIGLTLDDGTAHASSGGGGGRRRRKGGGGGADDGSGDGGGDDAGGKNKSKPHVPGAPDFGGAEGAGGDAAAGLGDGGISGGELAVRNGGEAGGVDAMSADGSNGQAVQGGSVDPDGGASGGRSGRRVRSAAVSGPGGGRTAAPVMSLPSGFTSPQGPGGEDAPAASAVQSGAGARRGSEEGDIPPLPRLSGDVAGGRGRASAPAPSALPSAPSAARFAAAPSSQVAVAATEPAPPRGGTAAPVYNSSSDGPLRDSVAASPSAVPVSAAKASPSAPANTAPSRSAVPAAILLSSAALGALGLFLRPKA